MTDEHLNKRVDNLEDSDKRQWRVLDDIRDSLARVEENTRDLPALFGRTSKLELAKQYSRGFIAGIGLLSGFVSAIITALIVRAIYAWRS